MYQGDYSRETVFSEKPTDMVSHWQHLGAKRLHIVDLDGAAAGRIIHWDVISRIAAVSRVPLQVGGGVRDLTTVEKLLKMGVARAILGTAAVENPVLVEQVCSRFGDRVIVSVDARDGIVATRGWKKTTNVEAVVLARQMADTGVRRLIYTDISADGTMTEPNFSSIQTIASVATMPIVAAGGISTLEHLRKLRSIGVEGAIVGRALYAGTIDLKEALEVLSHE